ncbi:MAG: hypothetical protein LLF89_03150 [Spirochaetaceae bacterium]|nr:hypothetical protein [Spirochaetaceae bacterium]
MKMSRSWSLIIISCLFAVGLVWQTSRFADLSEKAHNLELEQQSWIAWNKRLEADIALLSSRKRTSEMANYLGLKKVQPEERMRIQIIPTKPGTQVSSAKSQAAGEDKHD